MAKRGRPPTDKLMRHLGQAATAREITLQNVIKDLANASERWGSAIQSLAVSYELIVRKRLLDLEEGIGTTSEG